MTSRRHLPTRGSAGTFYLALVSVVLAWAVWFITHGELTATAKIQVTVEAVSADPSILRAFQARGERNRVLGRGPSHRARKGQGRADCPGGPHRTIR